MRHYIDLAWLRRQDHQSWFKPTLAALQSGLNRVRLHELQWLEQPTPPGASVLCPDDTTRVLANATLDLRRFDALLLTVSLDTLVWTRRCLAALPKAPVVPIIGVLNGLQSGAMIDLLELGLTDFVQASACPHEFRARLVAAVFRSPRYIPLREPKLSYGHAPADPRNPAVPDPRAGIEPLTEPMTVSHLVWPSIPFQENKQRVITLFERQYLQVALRRANGNITQAARFAQKDRRSFWELMRRHKIASSAQA